MTKYKYCHWTSSSSYKRLLNVNKCRFRGRASSQKWKRYKIIFCSTSGRQFSNTMNLLCANVYFFHSQGEASSCTRMQKGKTIFNGANQSAMTALKAHFKKLFSRRFQFLRFFSAFQFHFRSISISVRFYFNETLSASSRHTEKQKLVLTFSGAKLQ